MKHLFSILICFWSLSSCKDSKTIIPAPSMNAQDSVLEARLRSKSNSIQYAQPDSAIQLHLQRKAIFARNKNDSGVLNCYNALIYINSMLLQDQQKGKIYLDSAWAMAQKPQNKHLQYKAYYGNGIYQMNLGDLDSATQSFLKALELQPTILDSNLYENTHSLLSDIFASQGNYSSALNYFEPLIKKAEREIESPNSVVFFLGAYAYAIENKGKESLAFRYLHQAKDLAHHLEYTAMNAAIYTYMAEFYQKQQKLDSSNYYAQIAIESIKTHPQAFDRIEKPYLVLLNNYCSQSDFVSASRILNEALSAIDESKILKDDLLRLYEVKYTIYHNTNTPQKAYSTLQQLNKLQTENYTFLKNDQLLKHEKELKKLAAETTILKKDAQIRKQKTFNYILIGALVLLAFLIAFIIIEVKRRRKINEIKMMQELKEKELQQEKELVKVQIDERNRISQEMHDDLGSTLTTVQLGLNLLQNEPSKSEYLHIIDKATNTLSFQINEAIWNLNVKNDTLYSLVGYFEAYAKEFLMNTDITLQLNQDKINNDIALTGITRRSLYLTLKELLNNTVKYAQAKKVDVDFESDEKYLTIRVKDDGIGFDISTIQPLIGKGNGLTNIKKNIALINGTIEWKTNKGTEVIIQIPLN